MPYIRTVLENLKRRAQRLKAELTVLYQAYRDPRTPLTAKVAMVFVLAYALSPIDLIPDFIPILGYLDDLLLLPLGIALALRLVPRHILEEHRAQADERIAEGSPLSWVGGGLVVLVWSFLGLLLLRLVWLSRSG